MPENDLTPQEYVNPTVAEGETEKDLEKRQHREQVMKAVEAWKKLRMLPALSPLSPPERKKQVEELTTIINTPSDEIVLEVASDAFQLIKKADLKDKSSWSNKDEQDRQKALILKRELDEIIDFAQARGIKKDNIEKAGTAFNDQATEREKNDALIAAKEAALKLRKLQHKTGGFPFTITENGKTVAGSDKYPEEYRERFRLQEFIENTSRMWRFSEAEVNADADAYSVEQQNS